MTDITHYTPSDDSHISVMLDEVVQYMAPKEGETYVDGTFGAGGYSRALLDAAKCNVYGVDRDPYVEVFVSKLKEEYADRFSFLKGRFANMQELLKEKCVSCVDGIVLDIGVSSMQLDTPRRGFSFRNEGPLDMRMGDEGETAASVVNSVQEDELAGIIFKYGGERMSRRIARAIVTARAEAPIVTTTQLAEIIRGAVRQYNDKIDPATRTFQALRIWVNNELGELADALEAAEKLLAPEGRLVVVTFHSEEDAIVKRFLQERSGKVAGVNRNLPLPQQEKQFPPTFSLLSRKAVKASSQEVAVNPRSRSAKLRAATRSPAAPWSEQKAGAHA
jgi:16S rRNA (cytosine1402-N4)-methyltransferase